MLRLSLPAPLPAALPSFPLLQESRGGFLYLHPAEPQRSRLLLLSPSLPQACWQREVAYRSMPTVEGGRRRSEALLRLLLLPVGPLWLSLQESPLLRGSFLIYLAACLLWGSMIPSMASLLVALYRWGLRKLLGRNAFLLKASDLPAAASLWALQDALLRGQPYAAGGPSPQGSPLEGAHEEVWRLVHQASPMPAGEEPLPSGAPSSDTSPEGTPSPLPPSP